MYVFVLVLFNKALLNQSTIRLSVSRFQKSLSNHPQCMSNRKSVVMLVTIPQGQLRGSSDTDINGRTYYSFLGIPYAKPPIGSLRFKDPEPPESWTDTRDATQEGSPCYSTSLAGGWDKIDKTQTMGSEDCLFLNVFTHELSSKSPKPVMVYIHGGAFTIGSSAVASTGPKILMTEDVVFVSINYRLGILGFLSCTDESVGNVGMKDMVQALKWVRENIKYFGGDSENVTVFGLSAGGAAVHYLVLSPLAKGLFHKAIAQSGCALNCWAAGKTNNYLDVAKALGITEKNPARIIKMLQDVPVSDLWEVQQKLTDYFDISRVRYFSPTIESSSSNAFLSDEPINLITSGKFNQLPLIMGYNDREGLVFVHDIFGPQLTSCSTDHLVPYTLKYDIDSEIYKTTNKEISKFYYGSDFPDLDNKAALCNVLTDSFFFRGIHSSVKGHAKTKPVYYYRFSADTALNFAKSMMGLKEPGAAHGDEATCLFKNSREPVIEPGTVEHRVMQRMVKMWTNFAKTGKPIPEKYSLLDQEWKPAVEEKLNYLEIGNELKAGVDPDIERMKFWDTIFARLPEKY